MSAFFQLDKNDLLRGLIVAVLGGLAAGLTTDPFSWGTVLHMGLAAGGAYLVKNLLTTSEGKFLGAIKVHA